jgi:hypothetical protein
LASVKLKVYGRWGTLALALLVTYVLGIGPGSVPISMPRGGWSETYLQLFSFLYEPLLKVVGLFSWGQSLLNYYCMGWMSIWNGNDSLPLIGWCVIFPAVPFCFLWIYVWLLFRNSVWHPFKGETSDPAADMDGSRESGNGTATPGNARES